jgi:hypothetical protein
MATKQKNSNYFSVFLRGGLRHFTKAYVSIRQHSKRQHTSAYVSIRQCSEAQHFLRQHLAYTKHVFALAKPQTKP